MRVWLCDWMIADSEPPLPSPGDTLADVGVRAAGRLVAVDAFDERGLREAGGGTGLLPTYLISGTGRAWRVISPARNAPHQSSFGEFVLDVGGIGLLARVDDPTQEIGDGDRIAVAGRLSIIGHHEWAGFGLPDVRRAWHVVDVELHPEGAIIDLRPVDAP